MVVENVCLLVRVVLVSGRLPHPEMGSLISQLLDFKTSRFNIALSPLGIQGLNATLAEMVPTMESEI